MFISKKRHMAIIKEMRHYWSSEFDRLRRENVRLTAKLEAKASFTKTVLPAPVPAVERPKYAILHLRSPVAFRTLCGESLRDLSTRSNAEVEHLVMIATPQHFKLAAHESVCADCLG